MKIEEIEKNELTIKTTKQKIDNFLDVPNPFPQKASCYLISGGMGTGKSSFIHSIMTATGKARVFKCIFDEIYYATPQEVFDSEENHPFKHHCPSRLHHDLTNATFNKIVEDAIQVKEDGGTSCLIIDDFSEVLKNKQVEQNLKRLIFKHRHLKLNIIISTLTLKSLARSLRSLLDVVILFKPKSNVEVDGFNEEIFGLSKQEAKKLFNYIFYKPYQFLFYNSRTHTFYKNFNKLKITEEE
jgi:adenosyl cobinamide kinase/adenosyl cobinamide phosphate guanylyltransferase